MNLEETEARKGCAGKQAKQQFNRVTDTSQFIAVVV
jgi:hypothetical protein